VVSTENLHARRDIRSEGNSAGNAAPALLSDDGS
jgi:hypothetical protein